ETVGRSRRVERVPNGARQRDSRRRSCRVDARIYVRGRASRCRESLADRRPGFGGIHETILRRTVGTETAPRRCAPRGASLHAKRSTVARPTILGRIHSARRMEVSHKKGPPKGTKGTNHSFSCYVPFVPFCG